MPLTEKESDDINDAREKRMNRQLSEFTSLMTLAEIPYSKVYNLENGYCSQRIGYYSLATPWYLFKTEWGLIEIGWRKRVISINWEDTKVRTEITVDDVTKAETMVHAWTLPKALEYLSELSKELKKEL